VVISDLLKIHFLKLNQVDISNFNQVLEENHLALDVLPSVENEPLGENEFSLAGKVDEVGQETFKRFWAFKSQARRVELPTNILNRQ